jgi:hypothetical protein
MGVWMVIAVELMAGYLGYLIGEERGMAKMENKRGFKKN